MRKEMTISTPSYKNNIPEKLKELVNKYKGAHANLAINPLTTK